MIPMQARISELTTKVVAKLESWVEAFVVMLPNILGALLVVGLFSIAASWVDKLVRRLLKRVSVAEAISILLGRVASVATRILGVFIALGMLQLEKTVTSLLAGVGVIGLALGFAFQDIAANFMSGVFMAIRRPFEPGDLVELAGRMAVVDEVELRSTTVTTLDGLWIQVPNKDVFQNPIVNYTKTETRRLELEVGVAYCDDLEKVRSVTLDAVADVPGRESEQEPEVFFTGFGDSSINFTLYLWLESSSQKTYLQARSEAMIAIKKAFDREGITIPFPIRTLDFGSGVVGGERIDQMDLRLVRASES
jgi:small conductance mechanosensitive channel